MEFITRCLLSCLLLALGGCAATMPVDPVPAPMRLDELATLSKTGASDDVVIAQLGQRGVAFVLSPQDIPAQREAGVSEGVLRYLQGRADAEQALAALIQRGRYRLPGYAGTGYLGNPYLGYYGGLHYYGWAGIYVIGRHGGLHHGGGRHHGGHH